LNGRPSASTSAALSQTNAGAITADPYEAVDRAHSQTGARSWRGDVGNPPGPIARRFALKVASLRAGNARIKGAQNLEMPFG